MSIRTTLATLLLAACFQAMACEPAGGRLDPVERLYRDFAWEAVIDQPVSTPTFLEQPDAVWLRYLSPRLVELLRRERDCAARTHEICQLDFDPIWASQDPGATQLTIVEGDAPDVALVTFMHPADGQRIRLTFSLVSGAEGWSIDDIHYQVGSSLRALLESTP
jgi:hypothetical protein